MSNARIHAAAVLAVTAAVLAGCSTTPPVASPTVTVTQTLEETAAASPTTDSNVAEQQFLDGMHRSGFNYDMSDEQLLAAGYVSCSMAKKLSPDTKGYVATMHEYPGSYSQRELGAAFYAAGLVLCPQYGAFIKDAFTGK